MKSIGSMVALAISLSIALSGAARAQDFVCPQPAQQTEANIKGEVDGKAQTFLRLGGAELKGNVEKTVVDLYSKYPGADRVAIISTMLSTTCNIIRNSKQMTDEEKLNKWMAILPIIRTFLPEEKKSQYDAPVIDIARVIARGNSAMSEEDYDRAIAEFNEVIRVSPNNAMAYERRGDAWLKKKNIPARLPITRKLSDLSQANGGTSLNEGWIITRLKITDEQ